MILFVLGGFFLLVVIGGLVALGVGYSKRRRREQIGPGFEGDDQEDEKPGTAV
jgi:hypothetical protein